MLEIEISGIKYSQIFNLIELSGGINGTSKTLKVRALKEEIKFNLGDEIKFLIDEAEVFQGKIFESFITTESLVVEFTAFDNSIYLNKNRFVKNFYNKVPSEIVKEICGELKLVVGELPKDTVKCTFPAINKTGYDILLTAYTIQHNKDKKIYSVACNNDKIEILDEEIYLDVTLNSVDDIRRSQYSESIKNMINQVVVYKTDGNNGQIIDKVANEEDKNKYGLFQDVLHYDEDMNNILNARDMLLGKEQKAVINVNGNIELKSGYSIGIYEPNSKLFGKFLIESDKHIWSADGDYETVIELGFERTMDKITFEKEKAKKVKTRYSLIRGTDREVVE